MASIATLPRPLRFLRPLVSGPLDSLEDMGEQLSFYGRTLGWTWRTLLSYKKEVFRLIAEVSLGSGALAVIGGSVGVIMFMTFFTGTEVGLEGYQGLNQIGISAFAGFTAQLGAMRISEEIDALEVMGIPSVPYLVTTRIIAGLVAVIPLYIVGLFASYFATRFIVTGYFHQSGGTYDHYFHQFLVPTDVFYSFLKVIIFSVVIMLIHCYYGYFARGGPAGVGVAVGRAVRTSIVAINVIDLFLSLALWGANTTVRIAG